MSADSPIIYGLRPIAMSKKERKEPITGAETEQSGLFEGEVAAEEIVSQRAFAKLVGVKQASIAEAIAKGRLPADCVAQTPQGKQLYKLRALAQWRFLHAERDTETVEQDGTPAELSKAAAADITDLDKVPWAKLLVKRQALIAGEKAQIAYMERCEIEGSMHRAEDVKAVWEDRIETAKSALLGIPGELCGELGIRLKKDQNLVNEVLSRVIDRICAGLAADPKPEIAEHRRRRVAKK